MSERIRIINLTRKLMMNMGVGTYFPIVQYRINSLTDEQIRKIYKIIRDEVETWP